MEQIIASKVRISQKIIEVTRKGKGLKPLKYRLKPLFLLVPGTRIELVQLQEPRDFKSLASTSSATQAPLNSILTGSGENLYHIAIHLKRKKLATPALDQLNEGGDILAELTGFIFHVHGYLRSLIRIGGILLGYPVELTDGF